ncbi:hypothetical protein ACEV7K_22210 [Vibrio parahaemolyticus]|nr:hypothetical protein [Vibrio parahaemolyticus]
MSSRVVQKITNSRSAFLEVIVAAIFIGVCVGIVATHIYSVNQAKSELIFWGAIATLIASMYALSRNLGSSSNAQLRIRSFVLISNSENKVVDVPRYDYHEDLRRYLKGAFEENSALKNQWDKGPMGSGFNFDMKSNKATYKRSTSCKLLEEATEYYVIDKLSTHLTDYFNKPQYPSSMLSELSRDDVPDILLSNRFMELFTKPMSDRAHFQEHKSSLGKVVAAFGPNGVIYHNFDLVLPKASNVSRGKENQIIIETDNFVLSIKVESSECNQSLPSGFPEYFLGKKFDEVSAYDIRLEVDVKFKILSVLRNNNWAYHEWLDSFLPKLKQSMSSDSYFEQIHWPLAYTIIQCGEVSKSKGDVGAEKRA